MEKTKIGYKVFRYVMGCNFGSIRSIFEPVPIIRFEVGIWKKREIAIPQGPYSLFSKRNNAIRFRDELNTYTFPPVKKVEYVPSKEKTLYGRDNFGVIDIMNCCFPLGTVFADAVKILSEKEEDDE